MNNPDRKSKEERESEDTKPKKGFLYIVSTPIGNDEDITLRALRVLKKCDIVVCEEPKTGARMLHKLNLKQRMELLNEQNEYEKASELIQMLEEGKHLCLVSDAGTPLFADPGHTLVRMALKHDIYISVVPGASSIMTAIVRSGFDIQKFYYAGFLSRKSEERLQELKYLKNVSSTVVLLETPYRMMPVLKAASEVMSDRKAYIGCNLTMPYETHHYGTFSELLEKFSEMRFKGEFIIVFEGNKVSGGNEYKSFKHSRTPSSGRRYSDRGYSGGGRSSGKRYSDRGYSGGGRSSGKRYSDKSSSGKRYSSGSGSSGGHSSGKRYSDKNNDRRNNKYRK
jgi:16S rRNA (cytidine1402-2'-O)-methyltransferase